jgi:hypothetical protein
MPKTMGGTVSPAAIRATKMWRVQSAVEGSPLFFAILAGVNLRWTIMPAVIAGTEEFSPAVDAGFAEKVFTA